MSEKTIWFVDSDDPSPSISEAQEFVGGTVALRFMRDGRQILMCEEGLLFKMPVNKIASKLFGNIVVGNVIILSGDAKWR